MFSLVVCTDSFNGIGQKGQIPWKCSEDMKFFQTLTRGHVVIMGRKTWDSLPKKLPDRVNIVLTQSVGKFVDGNKIPDFAFSDIISCLTLCQKLSKKQHKGMKHFVIGGATIYRQFLETHLVHEIYKNEVEGSYNCDVFFPNHQAYGKWSMVEHIPKSWGSMNHILYENDEEGQFLLTLGKVFMTGVERKGRNGGTKSVFGADLRFDLSKGFPLITTRPLPLRMIFEELMWILRGQTDVKILQEKGIHIWDANTTKEFIAQRGLPYEEGDIGPSYGFQMRHFGAPYVDCKNNYNSGTDQLANVIHLIKNDPFSRRILITLWNPDQVDDMTLPPCVWSYQFYVSPGKPRGRLSCKIVQRSSDIGLAGGWNIAGGALFTHMLAKVCDLDVGELIWSPADVHIYLNQVDGVKEQLSRRPYPFPMLIVNSPPDNNILNFSYDHINLIGYKTHKKIKLAMNA